MLGDTDAEEHGLATLEQKYSAQMRQIFPTKIDLPWLTLKTQIDQQIDLRPDFQRRDRWNDHKRSRFIESVIMNVPVPPVFLGEEQYGRYVVLDGRQRLTAAYRFLSNQLRLEGLEVWSELNGLTYEDIKERGFAATIERRFLPAILLTKESSAEVKYEVFDRLNTGGVTAELMEVRNAIFPGAFNSLLHELSAENTFRRLWGIPVGHDPVALEKNLYYRDMGDLELVLRFFALRSGSLQGVRFKDRLSEYMKERNTAYVGAPELRDEDAAVFRRATSNCYLVFGDDAFKPQKVVGKRASRSAPFADAVMQALADAPEDSLTDAAIAKIRKGISDLSLKNDVFRAAVEKGTNGESAIRNRIELAKSVVRSATDTSPRREAGGASKGIRRGGRKA